MQGDHVIQVILVHATKTATVKNHPKNILLDKNYLDRIVLVHQTVVSSKFIF